MQNIELQLEDLQAFTEGNTEDIQNLRKRQEELKDSFKILVSDFRQLSDLVRDVAEKETRNRQTIQSHSDRIENLESENEELQDRINALEEKLEEPQSSNKYFGQERVEQRQDLTDREEKLYELALTDPELMIEEIVTDFKGNLGSVKASYRKILNKNWQLPKTFLEKNGLDSVKKG